MVRPFEIPLGERRLLSEFILEYINIYTGNKNYENFWPKATKAYFDAFPILPTLFPGREVKDLNAAELEQYREEYSRLYLRIQKFYQWESFKYKKDMSKTDTDTPPIISAPRKRQYKAHEIYSKMFWQERLASIYQEEFKAGLITSKNALAARNRIAREQLKKEDEETICLVQDRLKMENDIITSQRNTSAEPSLEDITNAIDNLPQYLRAIFNKLSKDTGGWKFVVLMGGPHPDDGQIQTKTFQEVQHGETLFRDNVPDFRKVIQKPFAKYLKTLTFPPLPSGSDNNDAKMALLDDDDQQDQEILEEDSLASKSPPSHSPTDSISAASPIFSSPSNTPPVNNFPVNVRRVVPPTTNSATFPSSAIPAVAPTAIPATLPSTIIPTSSSTRTSTDIPPTGIPASLASTPKETYPIPDIGIPSKETDLISPAGKDIPNILLGVNEQINGSQAIGRDQPTGVHGSSNQSQLPYFNQEAPPLQHSSGRSNNGAAGCGMEDGALNFNADAHYDALTSYQPYYFQPPSRTFSDHSLWSMDGLGGINTGDMFIPNNMYWPTILPPTQSNVGPVNGFVFPSHSAPPALSTTNAETRNAPMLHPTPTTTTPETHNFPIYPTLPMTNQKINNSPTVNTNDADTVARELPSQLNNSGQPKTSDELGNSDARQPPSVAPTNLNMQPDLLSSGVPVAANVAIPEPARELPSELNNSGQPKTSDELGNSDARQPPSVAPTNLNVQPDPLLSGVPVAANIAIPEPSVPVASQINIDVVPPQGVPATPLTNEQPIPPVTSSQPDELDPPLHNTDSSHKRVSKPSKRNEVMDKIGTAIPGATPKPQPGNADIAAENAAYVKFLLLEHALGDEWRECVEAWYGLEAALGYGMVAGTKSGLPAALRPTEYSKWAAKSKNGERPYKIIPKIEDGMDFGLAITKWYNKIQPAFRQSPDGMPVSTVTPPVHDIDPWACLRRAGPNGLVTIMLLLGWWGVLLASRTPFQEDSTPLWKAFLADATSVFQAVKLSVPAETEGNLGKRKRVENAENVSTKSSHKK